MRKYYRDQLKGVDTKGIYQPNIKITGRDKGSATKWLALNKDSATVLVKWLTDNFINK